MLVFVGTYTRHTDATGIYAFEFDQGACTMELLTVNHDIANPSWLVRHPTLPVLYAVNEVSDREGGGTVSAFSYTRAGQLEPRGVKFSLGKDPCHLAVNTAGTMLFVSNYNGGSFASYQLEADGSLGDLSSFVEHHGKGIDPMRQKQPHVHSAAIVSRGGSQSAYIADLGIDRVVGYPVSAFGYVDVSAPVSSRLKPGAGPRHLCFDRAERFCFLINELDNTIVAFDHSQDGTLIELETYSTLPESFDGPNYGAHIAMSPDDRFLYASNRGHDSIVSYKIGADGELVPVQWLSSGGQHPRHFALTPSGAHLLVANRDSNNVAIFSQDRQSGALTAMGAAVSTPAPVSICFG